MFSALLKAGEYRIEYGWYYIIALKQMQEKNKRSCKEYIKNTAYSDHFLSFFLQFSFFFPIILFIGGEKQPVTYRCKLRIAY